MELFAKSIEYVNGYCYVDGVLQSSNDTCTTAGTIAIAILLPLILVGVALFIWWIITLVHALSHPDVPNRVLWIVLHFVGLGTLAAPIYYFAVQRPYNKSKVSADK
jgi:energy-coupling factor transporter transmembrane protein EcfT